MQLLSKFWMRVQPEPNSGCWLWLGASYERYGRFYIGSGYVKAYRFSYELHKGPIPAGLVIDHLCRTPECVNPDHLEAVTNVENVKRSRVGQWQKNKTHCPQGHEYSGYNLRVNPQSKRLCRACGNAWYKRNKGKGK